jgi:hypothetical protein
MNNNISCPVDNISVNENKIRITAFFVLLLALVYLLTGGWIFAAFLSVDFALRAFNLGNYSLLGLLSDAVVKQLKIKNKPTDRAPKRFAALLGFFFSCFILAAVLLHLILASQIATGALIVFATLESFAGFCTGCYVYSFIRRT